MSNEKNLTAKETFVLAVQKHQNNNLQEKVQLWLHQDWRREKSEECMMEPKMKEVIEMIVYVVVYFDILMKIVIVFVF